MTALPPLMQRLSLIAVLVLGLVSVSLALASTKESNTRFLTAYVDTTYPELAGTVHQVAAGEDFQAVLDAAAPGDVIELEAGAVFTGPFLLPRKQPSPDPARLWILIRSGAPDRPLPPEGQRVDPSHAVHMATLEAASGSVIEAAPGASHYRFEGIHIRPAKTGGSLVAKWAYMARSMVRGVDNSESVSSGAPFLYNLVSLGTEADRLEDLPHHIVFDRCYLHGDPKVGARRGIALNSRHTAVINSYLADFKEVGFDSQAICGWNGPGPFKIVNNYLEAAGENVMFGGALPQIEGLVPADIEIRGNHFAKPLAWKQDHASFQGTEWSVKNLFELKNAERVHVEGNLLEYNWPHAQNGFAILFTVRNEHGEAPWATVRDVTFRNNVVRHVASGVNLLGLDDNGRPSRKSRQLVFDNNLFLSVGGQWGGGRLFQFLQSTEGVVISGNTAEQTASIIVTDGKGVHDAFRFTDNVVPHNDYGIIGSDAGVGNATLQRDFPDAVMSGNVVVGGTAGLYPEGNEFPAAFDIRATLGDGPAGVNLEALCSALGRANPSPVDDLWFCRPGE